MRASSYCLHESYAVRFDATPRRTYSRVSTAQMSTDPQSNGCAHKCVHLKQIEEISQAKDLLLGCCDVFESSNDANLQQR